MVTSTDTLSQTQYIDTQDAKIDIDAIYDNIISVIDQYRSHVSVVNNKGLINQLITALNTATQSSTLTIDPSQYTSQILVDSNPQESRCHTFYRLVGLPVISPVNNSLYSPGFDASNSFKNQVLNQHYQVINDIAKSKSALFDLMDAREIYANSIDAIFAQSNPASNIANLDASVLALSAVGGGTVRGFSEPLVNSTDPFDTTPSNQSYIVIGTNSLGAQKLSAYTDVNGQPPSTSLTVGFLSRRSHFLKPFMVDPRVDITAQPPKAKICAPFITDSSKSVYAGDSSTGIVLVRPFIEYVCQSRFSIENNPDIIPARYQAMQSYIKSTPSVADQGLINQVTQGVATTLEDQIFLKNFNIMRAMIDRLSDAIGQIQDTESNYHWLPIPDPVQGLEGNIGTQNTFIQTVGTTVQLDPLATTRERDLVTLTAQIALANPNVQPAAPDIGGFAFASIQPLPDSNTTIGFGSQAQTSLDQGSKLRKKATDTAASALRDIEIIMGEFTGFGLSDAIAIYTALWTIDPIVLVNMLDDQAFGRMAANPNISAPEVSARKGDGARTMSAQAVLQAFETQVKLMYSLMDRLYIDRTQFNTK